MRRDNILCITKPDKAAKPINESKCCIKMKDSIPKLSNPDVKQVLKKMPLSKEELVNYLLRIPSSNKLEAARYKKLAARANFTEIIGEINMMKSKKKECLNIIKKCNALKKNVDDESKNLEADLIEQRIALKELDVTSNIIRELDFCSPSVSLFYMPSKLTI